MQRESNPVNLDIGQRVSATATAPRFAGGSAAQTVERGAGIQDALTLDLLRNVAGRVQVAADRNFEQAKQEKYMEGQLAALRGDSEDSLQGDLFTKDWAIAGFRDTLGRTKQAELNNKLSTDMQTLRKQTPEDMAKYLANMRSELMPVVEGMSREQRIATVGAQMTFEQAAMKTHLAEHKAWIIEDMQNAKTQQAASRLSILADAQGSGDADAVNAAVQHGVGYIVDSVYMEPRLANLPQERSKMVYQFIEASLEQNTPGLYQYLRDKPLRINGEDVFMLGTLSLADQTKLSRKYQEAQNATKEQRNMNWFQQLGSIQAAAETTGIVPITNDEYRTFLDYGVRSGAIPASRAGELHKDYLTMAYKTENQTALAQAYVSGDINAITGLGKNTRDAAEALKKTFERNRTPIEQQIATYGLALKNQNVEAAKALGELASPLVMQLGLADGKINEQSKAPLARVNALLDAANPTAQAMLYGGMSDAAALRLQRLRAFRAEGNAPEIALASVLDLEKREAAMRPAEIAALVGRSATADRKAIEQVSDIGVLERVGLSVSGLWNKVDAARGVFSPEYQWLGNNAMLGHYAAEARLELGVEFSQIGLVRPGASSDEKMVTASGRLAARTVKTDLGPIFMPKGMTAAQLFGLPKAVPNEVVGEAINTAFKEVKAKGNGALFKFIGNDLRYQEVNKDGTPIGVARSIDPSVIRNAIGLNEQTKLKRTDEQLGNGKVAKGPDGFTMTYNGENTAGVDSALMLAFRDNLVKNEGVRGKPYPDPKRGTNIGVGIGSGNDFYPKSVNPTRGEIEYAFNQASSQAAQVGAQLQSALGLRDKASFLLLSEMAYQSSPTFHTKPVYREFLGAAMRAKVGAATDEEVVQAFKATGVYQASGKERQAHYLALLNQALKG